LTKGKQPTHFIRRARIMEGQRDLHALDAKEAEQVGPTVEHGWSVVQQVWAMMEEKRAHGLKGRVRAMREHQTWRANGAFENIASAEKALEAKRKGLSLDEVSAQQRDELQVTQEAERECCAGNGAGEAGKPA
ncbi:unnamed protein product, partial [Diplocarpon coronariae]